MKRASLHFSRHDDLDLDLDLDMDMAMDFVAFRVDSRFITGPIKGVEYE